jgi:hypothetical protein
MIPFGQSAFLGRRRISLIPEVIAAILQTIEAGWAVARLRSEVRREADEVTITECLRDGMRVALDSFPWRGQLIVSPGTESRSREGLTKPDGRTDIPLYLVQIFLQTNEHDPHAIVECKRVSADSAHLAREYVLHGVDRFRAGKYSRNHDVGFMAGYVLSGTAAGAVQRINGYLSRRGRHTEILAAQTNSDSVWKSQHRRPQQRLVALRHVMLRFG